MQQVRKYKTDPADSYVGNNMNILAQTATLAATAITLIKFTWLSLSNPTKPNPNYLPKFRPDPTQPTDGPNPCPYLVAYATGITLLGASRHPMNNITAGYFHVRYVSRLLVKRRPISPMPCVLICYAATMSINSCNNHLYKCNVYDCLRN